VPEAYSPAFRTWYRTLLPLLGTRALRVVTVSKFSREELSRRAGISAEKVDVIPLGAEHILDSAADPAVLNRLPVEPGRYILAVGSQSPHKNLQAVTSAIAQLGSEGPPLVVAGAANPRIFAGSTPNGGPIHEVGYVTDGQLRALYEHALCFVFPSWYEGFGLPPLEAMACGCPTVVSDSASLPEVCGDAALYCNARRPDELAARLRVLIREPATRQELRQRGRARARMFTWERASTRFLDLLDRTCSA
jgi:glycosyltransferase involved in cell wall biosynthesis